MKLDSLLSALKKYLAYDREKGNALLSAVLTIKDSMVTLEIDSHKHRVSFGSRTLSDFPHSRRLVILRGDNVAEKLVSSSIKSIREYLIEECAAPTKFGVDPGPDLDDMALYLRGSQLHSWISSLVDVRNGSTHRHAEYVHLDTPPGSAVLRSLYSDSISLVTSEIDLAKPLQLLASTDGNGEPEKVKSLAVDLCSLDIFRSMLDKRAEYRIAFGPSCVYCASANERFVYQIKDPSYADRYDTLVSLMSDMEERNGVFVDVTPQKAESLRDMCLSAQQNIKATGYDIKRRGVTLELSEGRLTASTLEPASFALAEGSYDASIPKTYYDSKRMKALLGYILPKKAKDSRFVLQFLAKGASVQWPVLKVTNIGDGITRNFYLACLYGG